MNSQVKIAVGMSVYKNDRIECVVEAINSILLQTYSNFDFFIHVDGMINNDVFSFLKNVRNNDSRIKLFLHQNNLGLAFRMNEVIDFIKASNTYDFFARMDADDISDSTRFQKQVEFLLSNQNISVVGSDCIEISSSGGFIKYKGMDAEHSVILSRIIKRCPFNHPSVMMNTKVFDSGIRYKPYLRNTQDYYLWVDLLEAGFVFGNINEALIKFRVSDDFYSKRGLTKALNDVKSRLYAFKKLDVMTLGNIIHVLMLFFLRISPSPIKQFAYKYLR